MDEHTAALLLEHPRHVLDQQEVADQIDFNHGPPPLDRELIHGIGEQNAGVRYGNVDTAKFLQRALNGSLHIGLDRNVDLYSNRAAIRSGDDFIRHLLRALQVEIRHHHMRAFDGQPMANRLAQSLRAAGYQSDFVFECSCI